MSEASVEETSGSQVYSIRKPPEKASDCPSSLTRDDILALVKTYPCFAKYHPYVPNEDDRATSPPSGKAALYKAYFTSSGIRLPFTPFYLTVLSFYKIGVSQLHPFAVGKIIRFEVLSRALGQAPSLYIFRDIFLLARTGDWLTFTYRDKKHKLIDTPSKLAMWRFDFFFVDATFLSGDLVDVLRVGRNVGDKVLNSGSNAKVAKSMVNSKLSDVLRANCIPYCLFPPRIEGVLAMVGMSPSWDWNTIPVLIKKSTGERTISILPCILFCL